MRTDLLGASPLVSEERLIQFLPTGNRTMRGIILAVLASVAWAQHEDSAGIYGISLPAPTAMDMRTHVNLKEAMRLSGENLLATLSPTAGYLPYFALSYDMEAGHLISPNMWLWWPQQNIGRLWDALLRLESATGFVVPAAIEAAQLANLQRYYDNADHLLGMGEYDPSATTWPKDPSRGFSFQYHSMREGLMALAALASYRHSQWAKAQGSAMIRTLLDVVREDGTIELSRLHAHKENPGWPDQIPGQPYYTGRLIEPLVLFYQATGDADALRLAERIARQQFAGMIRADGSFDPQAAPFPVAHTHSYLGTLRGLLLYGEMVGKHEYVDAVAATFRKTVVGNLVKQSGYTSHDIGHDKSGEPASAGDAAQIALWLGVRHGHTELLDEVERIVRARLLPAQVTESPLGPDTRPHPERTASSNAPEDRFLDLDRRFVGAFAGLHVKPHSGKKPVTDISAAILHTLTDIYRQVAVRDATGLRVYLHFDIDNDFVRIVSERRKTASVTIAAKVKENVLVRVPGWAPCESIKLTVNGEPAKLETCGAFLLVGKEKMPGKIVLEYGLPITTTKEVTDGVEYEFLWRGDEIMGLHPNDDILPFYPKLMR